MQSKSILSCLVWGFVAAFNHSKVPGNETSCDHQSGDDVGELSDFYGPVSSEHKRKIRVGDENADLCCMPLSSARQVIHLMEILCNCEVLCMVGLLVIWLARIMLLFGLQCIVFILKTTEPFMLNWLSTLTCSSICWFEGLTIPWLGTLK